MHGHVSGFLQANRKRKDIEIVGVADPDPELAARIAKRYDLGQELLFSEVKEMLSKVKPEAVLAYTNTFDHRRVVELCAKQGVHVMMEKPLAVSFEDGLAMEKAATEGKIHVLVNYETTWYRSNRAAYDLVQEKALGDVRKIVVHDGHRGPKEIGCGPEFLGWLTDPKLNGAGALFDFGCYGADLATWLLDGKRPDTVTAVTQQIKPHIYAKVDDEATIVLSYPKAQVIIQASWNWPFDRKDMEVYGETGSVFTVRQNEVRVRRGRGAEELVTAKPLPSPQDDPVTYLRAVVRGSVKPDGLSSLATNLTVTEILDAARRSAATGKTVMLPASRASGK
ncbi:putative Rossmann-fold-type glycoside hydrolase [Limnoglobus roseus]|uniref:Putative Rossmann-fold-type glycoside hydrolase n=1 Tax=Limnoglobus roseus TaxID=2598579 RepID=A0A5C1A980_9BACT|nr:putative Rossmann-fold-type glycoside hydrolase [Limnoglobus roseus]